MFRLKQANSKQNNTQSAPVPSESVLKKETSSIKNNEKIVKPSAGIVHDTSKRKKCNNRRRHHLGGKRQNSMRNFRNRSTDNFIENEGLCIRKK